jgi:hypothetical protein
MHRIQRIHWIAITCLASCGLGVACRGYKPPLFAARAPVRDANDQSAEPVPRTRDVPEPIFLTEVYLHRPLRDALFLSTYPEAKDVNSFDEVPRSSWFTPQNLDIGAMARGPEVADVPQPPFTVLPDHPAALAAPGFCIRDSRGKDYDVAVDPADRPEMRTGALAVASRLVWALGFNVPGVAITRARFEDFWLSEGAKSDAHAILEAAARPSDGYYRIAAVAWPAGLYLGSAPEMGRRGDDPNDVVDHEDRRTLRALVVLASWLDIGGVGPSKTIDRYVGAPGEGSVVHYLTGLDAALAASKVVRITDKPSLLPGGGSPFIRFFTLGLLRNHSPPLTQVDVPAIGDLSDRADPAHADLPLPYAPADRLLASDGYWAAKLIAGLSSTHLALAIDAGKFSDPRVQPMMQHALEARARDVMAYWFSRVVPLELVSFGGTRLEFRDLSAAHGLVTLGVTDYRADFLGREGEVVAEPIIAHPSGAELAFDLPPAAARAAQDYLIVQITARRRRRWLPRGIELHIRPMGGAPMVVGLRH